MPLSVQSFDDKPAAPIAQVEELEVENAHRHRWSLTPRERSQAKRRMIHLTMNGSTEMIQIAATRVLVEMASRDQDDVHHLEGQRLTVEQVDNRPPQMRIAEVLAQVKARLGNVGAAGRMIDVDA